MNKINCLIFLFSSLRRKLFRFLIKYNKPLFLNFKIIFGSKMIISQVNDINNTIGNIIILTQSLKKKLNN